MVRMGELAATAGGGVLCTIGLGSCVGVALVDDDRGVAALAHVVLPDSTPHRRRGGAVETPGKFADTALPLLVERAVGEGAGRRQLRAVLVGGASMFALRRGGDAQEVGERNVSAVRDALRRLAVPVAAEDVGGGSGRTVRVQADGTVRVKVAGGGETVLRAPGAGRVRATSRPTSPSILRSAA
jgi:chemotaxis protein CheD